MTPQILSRGAEGCKTQKDFLHTSDKCKKLGRAPLANGAEAIIYLKDDFVIKKRIKKSYRIKEIDDKIRKLRTRGEAKLIERASKVINVPKISKPDETSKEILMEFIDGKKLSLHLDGFDLKEQRNIAKKIGENISKIHDANIIHGDLTTSNMIWRDDELYFIDFGLGYHSTKIEDRATDLYLLKQALEAKHFENFEVLFREVLKNYKSRNKEKVLEQLKKVEKRRRYK